MTERFSPRLSRRVAFCVVWMAGATAPAAAQVVFDSASRACITQSLSNVEAGAGDVVRELLIGSEPTVVPSPRLAHVRAWIAREIGVASIGRAMRASGRARRKRWSVQFASSPGGGMRISVVIDTNGDCPNRFRRALWYDASGRLVKSRKVSETCEGVDAAIEEDVLTYESDDARARIASATRTHYRHPGDVEGMEARTLTDEVALDDGTMPPTHDVATCAVTHGAASTGAVSLRCAIGGTVALEATCPR